MLSILIVCVRKFIYVHFNSLKAPICMQQHTHPSGLPGRSTWNNASIFIPNSPRPFRCYFYKLSDKRRKCTRWRTVRSEKCKQSPTPIGFVLGPLVGSRGLLFPSNLSPHFQRELQNKKKNGEKLRIKYTLQLDHMLIPRRSVSIFDLFNFLSYKLCMYVFLVA